MDRLLLCLLLVFCSLTLVCCIPDRATEDEVKAFFSKLDSSQYDKRIRPNYGGEAVTVNVTMYIIGLHDYCPKNHAVKMSAYFRQAWHDKRLAHDGQGNIYAGAEVRDKIWLPDTFFPNSLGGQFTTTIVPNAFVRVSPNGEVLYSERVTENVRCMNGLHLFPVDSLICGLEVESYGYSALDIKYQYASKSAVGTEYLIMDQFKLEGTKQIEKLIELSTGTYSRIIAEVSLSRRACGFVTKYILPLVLVTSLSFATYCLPASLIRTAATLAATFTTVIAALIVNRVSPASGSANSVDIFGLICILFSIVSLRHELTAGKSEEAEKKVEPKTLRERAVGKVVPLTFVAFLICYTVTMTIIKHSSY